MSTHAYCTLVNSNKKQSVTHLRAKGHHCQPRNLVKMKDCRLIVDLLDDLLQLFVLSLQLAGFFFVVVISGRAGLHGLLLIGLPLATCD